MSRKESKVCELHTKKGTWKIAVRLTDMWFSNRNNGKASIEMVLMDETGTKIGGILPQELFPDFQDLLKCGESYILQNIKVVDNTSDYKVSRVPYMVYFVKTTSIRAVQRPEILHSSYAITSFSDILSGEAPRDTLVDVVGLIVDVLEQYTLKPTYRVSVKLRDNSDEQLIMTVWEDYAAQLGAAIDKNRVDKKPLVVLLTLAKIKEPKDKYPLSVQNIKVGSKLYINDDVPEIQAFYERMDLDKPYYTAGALQGGCGSQTQFTQYSQGSGNNRFLQNARIVSLDEIGRLGQDSYCLSVGTVDEILIESPWSYDSCPYCTTTFDPKKFGTLCRTCQNMVTEIVPRFKIVLRLENNGQRRTFHFWDALCVKIFGKSAEECRNELIAAGEDIKVFPQCVDDLIGKTWAIRFKYRVQMRQCSVMDVSNEQDIIDEIATHIADNLDDASTLKGKSVAVISSSQEPYPTPSLSQSAEYDPTYSMLVTPAKRMPDMMNEGVQSQEYTPFQLSSNKHIKSEKLRAHLNVEWCNQSTSIKYLFKYINKGSDRITAAIVNVHNQDGTQYQVQDEIKHYLDCRYVSPPEACWKIYAFGMHGRAPAVERLFFHLQDQQPVYWTDTQIIGSVLSKKTVKESMFTAWMDANKRYAEGRNLTYAEYVTKFVYVKHRRCWQPRKQGYTIGRLIWVPPSSGELFYLRMMLSSAKGPRTYREIRIVNNVEYPTYREACFAMGFLGNDQEFIGALEEAQKWGTAHYLRKLFVKMLFMHTMDRPEYVWEKTWQWLADDILYNHRRQGIRLTEDEVKHHCLTQIEVLLQACRKSLRDFPSMPYPIGYAANHHGNKLIQNEMAYDKDALQHEFKQFYTSLTDEQSAIFGRIMRAVQSESGGVFFLYGYGGTGKTYIWKTLSSAIRSGGDIVLTVASSGIASLLLPGGRTTHSKFVIPVPATHNSTCNIHQGSDLAELLKVTKLIIWDEAPMCHKYSFEALDKSLKDIMNNEMVFGAKVVVFGGDFRQILPVVPKGTRSDIVHASINASYIWDHCEVLRLTKNMRLQGIHADPNNTALKEFSKWLLDVGDGKVGQPNDGYAEITIPDELLIKDYNEPIKAIVDTTYPNLIHHYNDGEFLKTRAVLASTVDIVDNINDYVMSLIPGDEKEYYSADSIDKTDELQNPAFGTLTPEFLHSLKTSSLPNHKLKLKVGTPIMLLRNLDQSDGLCNGTRLIITKLGKHVVEAQIITGSNIGHITYIPRMNMSPSESPWPFKLIRRQFPFMVSFAMTINKSQGQSLAHVGLYLPKPVFCHGQLYVALSRVQSKEGLHILIHDKHGIPINTTTNVVYKEVFGNL